MLAAPFELRARPPLLFRATRFPPLASKFSASVRQRFLAASEISAAPVPRRKSLVRKAFVETRPPPSPVRVRVRAASCEKVEPPSRQNRRQQAIVRLRAPSSARVGARRRVAGLPRSSRSRPLAGGTRRRQSQSASFFGSWALRSAVSYGSFFTTPGLLCARRKAPLANFLPDDRPSSTYSYPSSRRFRSQTRRSHSIAPNPTSLQ